MPPSIIDAASSIGEEPAGGGVSETRVFVTSAGGADDPSNTILPETLMPGCRRSTTSGMSTPFTLRSALAQKDAPPGMPISPAMEMSAPGPCPWLRPDASRAAARALIAYCPGVTPVIVNEPSAPVRDIERAMPSMSRAKSDELPAGVNEICAPGIGRPS